MQILNKLWSFARLFLLAKKVWRRPTPVDIVMIDPTGLDVLEPYLRAWSIDVIHIEGDQLSIPVLWQCVVKRKLNVAGYIDQFIQITQPRLVLTFLDNNHYLYPISSRHSRTNTMFIQNGYRGYYSDVFEYLANRSRSGDVWTIDYMATFGPNVGREFARHLSGRVVPIGSLKNNMVARTPITDKNVIAVISQYRNTDSIELNGRCFTFDEYFLAIDKIIFSVLMDYVENHGKEIVIVQRYSNDTEKLNKEREYFSMLAGDRCRFSVPEWHDSSYIALDKAEITVVVDSTLGYESLARGNKTAFFSARGTMLDLDDRTFGWPAVLGDDGPFWTNRPDPEALRRIIDHLFEIDDRTWSDEVRSHAYDDIMIYDPGNTKLRALFDDALAADGSGNTEPPGGNASEALATHTG